MTAKFKSLNKFLKNPSSSSYKTIESILLILGFKKIYAKGSHVKFKHEVIENDLIIPVHNNECKNFYKKLTAKIIKKNLTKLTDAQAKIYRTFYYFK